jgi:hypothetical protein
VSLFLPEIIKALVLDQGFHFLMVVIPSNAKDLRGRAVPQIQNVSDRRKRTAHPKGVVAGTASPQLVAYGSIFNFDPVLHSVIGFTVRTS